MPLAIVYYMEIRTNKNNWSGDEVVSKINQSKKTFNLYDHTFKIVRICKGVYKIYNVDGTWDRTYSLGDIYDMEDHFVSTSVGIELEGETMYHAAIKLLCNTI